MDLQNTFYLLGIVYMVLGILLLISIIVLLFYIKVKIGKLQDFIEERINDLLQLTIKPMKKAADTALGILPKVSKKTKKH